MSGKFSNQTDIELAIQVLRRAIEKTEGSYAHEKIKPSLNRVIFDLEELAKEPLKLTK